MSTKIEFLGYAAFEISTSQNLKILIDPYLNDNPQSPLKVKDLEKVDLILVTHGAFDHLGDAGAIAKKFGSPVICGADVQAHLIKEGVSPDQVKAVVWGLMVEEVGIKIRAVESRHCSFIEESDGSYLSGISLGFIIYADSVGIYHSGDTAIFSDIKLIGELYHPDIGLVNITVPSSARARGTRKIIAGEMSPYEAALAAQWLRLKYVIPMHFDDPNQFDVHSFVNLLENMTSNEKPHIKVVVLKPGETFTYEPNKEG